MVYKGLQKPYQIIIQNWNKFLLKMTQVRALWIVTPGNKVESNPCASTEKRMVFVLFPVK